MKNSSHLLKYLKFQSVLNCSKELDRLSKAKNKKDLKKFIREAEECVINAISEIAKNCIYGNIPLNKCDFRKLSKYQGILRKISKKSSVSNRRKLINQKGGFLSLLIPPALSLIASVIGGLINKKLRDE